MITETNKYGTPEAACVVAHECYGIRNALDFQQAEISNMIKANMLPGPHGFTTDDNKAVGKALRAVLQGIQAQSARNEARLEDVLPWTI